MSDRRNKGRISGPFVPMIRATMKEPAWLALPTVAAVSAARSALRSIGSISRGP